MTVCNNLFTVPTIPVLPQHPYCKLKKASYNIFFHQSSNGEISLYTLRLSSGYNDLLNSENLKVAIAQLCHDIEVCNFTML